MDENIQVYKTKMIEEKDKQKILKKNVNGLE